MGGRDNQAVGAGHDADGEDGEGKEAVTQTTEIPDAELVARAIASSRSRSQSKQRWVAVMHIFCLGSTSAQALCKRFGFDPDEEVPNV
jgi:hypothetical protein